jgi:hypothetical protein
VPFAERLRAPQGRDFEQLNSEAVRQSKGPKGCDLIVLLGSAPLGLQANKICIEIAACADSIDRKSGRAKMEFAYFHQ